MFWIPNELLLKWTSNSFQIIEKFLIGNIAIVCFQFKFHFNKFLKIIFTIITKILNSLTI